MIFILIFNNIRQLPNFKCKEKVFGMNITIFIVGSIHRLDHSTHRKTTKRETTHRQTTHRQTTIDKQLIDRQLIERQLIERQLIERQLIER